MRIDAGPGSLPRIRVTGPLSRCEVCLQGAHLCSWEPTGQPPVVWMTGQSEFAFNTPIRGGVPICWPWFGPATDPTLPMHGVVRTRRWSLEGLQIEEDGTANIDLSYMSDHQTREQFPHDFTLRYRITAGRSLTLELHAFNSGQTAFTVAEALHAYIAVGDISSASVHGLENSEYLDRCERLERHLPGAAVRMRHGPEPLTFTNEVDRHYTTHHQSVRINDPTWNRTVTVEKSGSASTQVWNPWITKAHRLPDLGNHEWRGMLAVEAANAFDAAYVLEPGASHVLSTTISVITDHTHLVS